MLAQPGTEKLFSQTFKSVGAEDSLRFVEKLNKALKNYYFLTYVLKIKIDIKTSSTGSERYTHLLEFCFYQAALLSKSSNIFFVELFYPI